MSRMWFVLVLGLLAASGLQAADSATGVVRAAVSKLSPGARVSDVGKAPIPGFYQALVGGRLVYVSDDGTYVLDGRLFNTRTPADLTAERMAAIRRQAIAAVPASDKLVFAPKHPKYTITVFTDIDCPYCRALHKQVPRLNAEGVAVDYLFWPRSGVHAYPSGKPTASYLKAVSVWCAADRKKALATAMDGGKVASASCSNPVQREFRLGDRIGVDGTPTIVGPNGAVLGGYLTADQVLQALQGGGSGGAG